MTGLRGRASRGQSARRSRAPKLPDAFSRTSTHEEARELSKSSSKRHGASKTEFGSTGRMRTSVSESHFSSLPKISSAVRAASFEELLADAQRRAVKRRVQARKENDDGAERLPFLKGNMATINKNTIAGYQAFSALMRDLNQRSVGDLAAMDLAEERKAEEEEKKKAEKAEIARMTRLTMLAASALTEQKDQAMKIPSRRGSVEEAKSLNEEQKRKMEDAAIQAAEREREKDPDEVAEVLRPPDFELAIERFNWDGPGVSERELRRIEELFNVYKTQGQGDVHLDRLYEMLTSLGYMSIDEAMIKKMVSEITPFSALEKQELIDFLRKYSLYEREIIRKAFHEFDEDNSGELSTNEVRAVLEAVGCSPFRGTLQRLINAVDANQSQTLDFKEFLSLLLVYRQTDGFSHKEIRQMYRTFCRFAVEDPGTKLKKVPEHRLTAALIFEFGAQAAELARSLATKSRGSKIMRGGRSPWQLAASSFRASSEESKSGGLTFRQFIAWSRRMKEAEVAEYVRQFKKFDSSGDGVLDRSEVKTLLSEMGYTPMRSNVQDLFDTVDMDGDNTINLEEYLDVMDYFKKWDGFTGKQAEDLHELFNKYCDENGEVSSMQIMDIFRARGININLRSIQQLVAKVDVDETHSLDFKEFLRLMRLQREAELLETKEAFFVTLQETIPAEEFDKIEEGDNVTIRPEDLLLATQLLDLRTDKRELRRLSSRHTQDEKIDFDNFVALVDELRYTRHIHSRKQASYSKEEVADFQRAFNEFDGDGSGEIDRDEISRLLRPLGLELKTKEDQKRLIALLNAARASAAESGVDASQCGKMGTAVVRFPVFIHMCRLLQREKEAKALAEEEAEAGRMGFSEAQTKKLHSSFCLWAAQAEDDAPEVDLIEPNEKEKDFNELATLSSDGFCKLCMKLNPRIGEAQLEEIKSLLGPLREVSLEGDVSDITSISPEELKKDGVIHAEVREVSFPLFVRCLRWMIANDFAESSEAIKI